MQSTATRIVLAIVMMGISTTQADDQKPNADPETVIYDEAEQGDFGPTSPDAKPAVQVARPGVFVVKGTGTDVADDADAFVFQVTGEKPFDFCLVADAAEFKWLRAIKADGSVEEVAFASTNLASGVPRNISKDALPPGTYRVEMYFGPEGASGPWVAKIAPSDGTPRKTPLCQDLVPPSTAEKMEKVDWPGAISIFHGHNWGDDENYVVAIKEAGFAATGAAEWQIDHCRKQDLRAFVFIWAHEAATIPPKYKDDATVLCYYLSDRIPPQKWGVWATNEQIAFQADPYHPAVFTMRGLWGGIEQFCPTVRGRAMEYYHYHWDGNRAPHMHFALLEQYRQASAENGYVPICRIVETRPEDMRKTRQTVYTSLAYGVRAFRMGGGGTFDTEKRDERGVPTRTAFGEELKSINMAINAYSPVFKTARCEAVYHVAPLPQGCQAAPEDSWVTLEGEDVLVGLFRVPDNAGEEKTTAETVEKTPRYLLVANRNAFQPETATLTIRGKVAQVRRMNKETAQWETISTETKDDTTLVRVELAEGSGELLEVVF